MPQSVALCLLAALASGQIIPSTEPPKTAGVTWQADHAAACKKATAEGKPVIWSVMIHRETACRRMVRRVWTDKRVVELAKKFVLIPCNPYPISSERLFPDVTAAQVRANELEMRSNYARGEEIIAPQHIITTGAGKLIVRKDYELDVAELLALMNKALGKPVADAKPGKAPAPKPAKDDEASPEEPPAPASDEPSPAAVQLLKMIIKVKSSEKEDLTDEFLKTATLPDVKLLASAISEKKIRGEKDRAAVLRRTGYDKYRDKAEALLPLIVDKSQRVRNATVVSLEEMQNQVAAEALLERFKKERDSEVKKDILRALGPTGAGNEEARDLLMKYAGKRSTLGLNALMALGSHLAGDEEVRKLLRKRWSKTDKKFHLAIIYAYWVAKDPDTAPDLEWIKKRERSGTDHDLAERVLAIIEGRRAEVGGGRGRRNRNRGAGGGEWRLLLAFRPLFEQDKVERNAVKDFRDNFGGGRFGR